ncbi:ATP-binding cassette domain-containing protein [Nocardioides sp. NPDC000445]|uniref:ATP-binding cassette domain-containing protein n=1 Tax=Nocardioides sp. NPDC000445 TaxID=3154257 RepID=UPI003317E460
MLDDVSFDVRAGEVLALAGGNGAGKSVLIKCLSGLHQPDSGRIIWQGKEVHLRTPSDASALGIATVYQDLAMCDNLDVVQNMFLGRERRHRWTVDDEKMELAARATLRDLGVTSLRSVGQKVAALSGGQRQSVAIAKAVLWHSELVIMDEPTAALGVVQTEVVLQLIRTLADKGLAVIVISHNMIVISHNMNDVFRVVDRIAVLYLGRLAGVRSVSELSRMAVIDLMATGRSDRLGSGGQVAAELSGGS